MWRTNSNDIIANALINNDCMFVFSYCIFSIMVHCGQCYYHISTLQKNIGNKINHIFALNMPASSLTIFKGEQC